MRSATRAVGVRTPCGEASAEQSKYAHPDIAGGDRRFEAVSQSQHFEAVGLQTAIAGAC